ncbi:hypothetical protein ACFLU5_12850 [Bacteroidota bacterium]
MYSRISRRHRQFRQLMTTRQHGNRITMIIILAIIVGLITLVALYVNLVSVAF